MRELVTSVLSFKKYYVLLLFVISLRISLFLSSIQSATSQGFSQKDGTTEVVGMVYWDHPNDLNAMEDCDWPIRKTGSRGAER